MVGTETVLVGSFGFACLRACERQDQPAQPPTARVYPTQSSGSPHLGQAPNARLDSAAGRDSRPFHTAQRRAKADRLVSARTFCCLCFVFCARASDGRSEQSAQKSSPSPTLSNTAPPQDARGQVKRRAAVPHRSVAGHSLRHFRLLPGHTQEIYRRREYFSLSRY